MTWVSDHIVVVTAVLVLIGIALAVAIFAAVVRWVEHASAASAGSTGVSLVVAILFSVCLTQLWNYKRDRDQRIWTLRARHMQRLQPVLRLEADRLKGLAAQSVCQWPHAGPRDDALSPFSCRVFRGPNACVRRFVLRHAHDFLAVKIIIR